MPFPLIIMWGYVYGIKIFRKNCCGLDVHKTWIYACIGLLTPTIVQNTKKLVYLPFQKNCRNCLIGLLNIPVLMFVWNHQVNTRFLALKSLRKPVGLLLLILNIPNRKKETKQTERMPNGFVTCICVIWSNPALFHHRIFASCVI